MRHDARILRNFSPAIILFPETDDDKGKFGRWYLDETLYYFTERRMSESEARHQFDYLPVLNLKNTDLHAEKPTLCEYVQMRYVFHSFGYAYNKKTGKFTKTQILEWEQNGEI